MDKQFQSLVDELKSSGEWDNTIIIWYSDNGGPLPRQKRTVNESGTLVPFMIRFPDGYRKGEIDDRLCSFPDIPATILSLAGIQPPSYMQGQAFLGKYETSPRSYVYGGRDRMDEQIDKQGYVRDKNSDISAIIILKSGLRSERISIECAFDEKNVGIAT